ncbi:hypothetical protein ACC685_38340, partial [Rhizobium ruizarguesonis]
VQTAEIASDWTSVFQAHVLTTVALHTEVGFSTFAGAITSVALFVAVFAGYWRTAVALAGKVKGGSGMPPGQRLANGQAGKC